ncbi:hypothetical protein [Thiobacillus denitrificans]|uniref:Uncharacterized protein n=1 Tax=Thiobacillus denitrificans TaxID=36861 RepID=A0A119CWY6_THIDE|nr:hypothetical protein [Thiobacillus denitrificans]KVW97394.1 hypothetical protein ABW22_04360 [Thiobacillus denitrificans]
MNTRQLWIFGLTALGLALAAPVQAAPDLMDGAFIVAQRDRGDEVRPDQRDARQDARRAARREAESEEPQGYGYGYERRQQKQQQRMEDDSRDRDRR